MKCLSFVSLTPLCCTATVSFLISHHLSSVTGYICLALTGGNDNQLRGKNGI